MKLFELGLDLRHELAVRQQKSLDHSKSIENEEKVPVNAEDSMKVSRLATKCLADVLLVVFLECGH